MASLTPRSPLQSAGALLLGIALALVAVAPAAAASAFHFRAEIHDSYVDDNLSNLCGTLVVGSVDASLNVTLLVQDGTVAKEIDPAGGGRITVSAPETGGSFSYPFNTVIIEYPLGGVLNAPFTMTFTGMIGDVPGHIAADAGRIVLAGYVAGVDEFGLPDLEITDFVSFNGHESMPDDIGAAMCEALAG